MGEGNDLCGFIIGGLNDPGNLGYRAYITDIKMIWDEVEQITGEKPELPGLPFYYYAGGSVCVSNAVLGSVPHHSFCVCCFFSR